MRSLNLHIISIIMLHMSVTTLGLASRNSNQNVTSRRGSLAKFASLAFTGSTATTFLFPDSSVAEIVPGTIWISGKQPKVPGMKKRDPNDTKGTRKDAGFLRSVSDCKSQCDNSRGSDGYAKTKEECLSDCQDICCTTYEQCTFAITPRD